MVDLRQLRSFVVLAEELHFGRAAQKIRLAQPALTRQVQRLEQELGTALLMRTSRQVGLTEAGRFVHARSRSIIADVTRMMDDAARVGSGETGVLAIGFVHSTTYDVLPALLARFRASAPQVEIRLREMRTPDQLDALEVGKLDVGLIRQVSLPPGILGRTLVRERYVVAVPEAHRFGHRKSIRVEELAADDWVTFSPVDSPMFHDSMLSLCARAGFSPRSVQEATHVHTVVGLVSGGFGIALVPEIARTLPGPKVRFLEVLNDQPDLEILLARSLLRPSPVAARFMQCVVEAA